MFSSLYSLFYILFSIFYSLFDKSFKKLTLRKNNQKCLVQANGFLPQYFSSRLWQLLFTAIERILHCIENIIKEVFTSLLVFSCLYFCYSLSNPI